MAMSTHRTQITVELFGQEFTADVEFCYVEGIPESGPTYDSGGEPACGPEITVHSVEIPSLCEKLSPAMHRLACRFVEDECVDDLIEAAEGNSAPDPDAWRDQRREERMEARQ
jgi:hypothetical protein